MSYKSKINVVADAQVLAEAAVELFALYGQRAIERNGLFRVAVSGGRTPRCFFELLGRTASTLDFPWDLCHVFWVDERFVPVTSDASNYKLAKDIWLDRVPIPKANIYPVPTDVENTQEAARRYESTLRHAFALIPDALPEFDLLMLGMGRDGHTASLLPGTLQSGSPDGLVWAIDAADYTRITLTPAVIQEASHIVVLVSGKDKADTFKAVLAEQAHEMELPIRILWPVLERVQWLVDKDAAAELDM